MDKNYAMFLKVNELQSRELKIESQMNELWNDRRKIDAQRLILGKTKAGLEKKWKAMIINHNKIKYVKVNHKTYTLEGEQ